MEPGRAPFPAGSFELVFSYHVLEHVADLAATVADMARLVAPGGRLFAALPCGNAGSLEHGLAARLTDGLSATGVGWRFSFEAGSHLRRLTTDEVVDAFAACGLPLERAAFANHFWGAIEWICRGGAAYVEKTLDPARGRDRRVRLALQAGRGAARLIAADFKRRRRLGLAAATAKLAEREWRRRRSDPAGSAQYLVFSRPSLAAEGA
jgi:SAM-dependent methyltransferase